MDGGGGGGAVVSVAFSETDELFQVLYRACLDLNTQVREAIESRNLPKAMIGLKSLAVSAGRLEHFVNTLNDSKLDLAERGRKNTVVTLNVVCAIASAGYSEIIQGTKFIKAVAEISPYLAKGFAGAVALTGVNLFKNMMQQGGEIRYDVRAKYDGGELLWQAFFDFSTSFFVSFLIAPLTDRIFGKLLAANAVKTWTSDRLKKEISSKLTQIVSNRIGDFSYTFMLQIFLDEKVTNIQAKLINNFGLDRLIGDVASPE
jgi:hypothetical protein